MNMGPAERRKRVLGMLRSILESLLRRPLRLV
jgi:hypothetical protein